MNNNTEQGCPFDEEKFNPEIQVRIIQNEVKVAWDMALTIANNICVQLSDRFNDDDENEKATGASDCAKQIRVGIGQYPEELSQQSASIPEPLPALSDPEIAKIADGILSELKKDENHITHQMSKDEVIGYNTGFFAGYKASLKQ